MKLIELTTRFRGGETFEDFCKAQGLNAEPEMIDIYFQQPVILEAQVSFLPIEETEGCD